MKNRISAFIALLASTTALAATQGQVGDATSSGSVDITLDVGTSIVAKNFGDMNLLLAGTAPGAPVVGEETFCVGGIGFNEYTISFSSFNGSTGGNTGAAFELETSGGTDQLAYQVGFANDKDADDAIADADSTGAVSGKYPKNGDLGCSTDNAKLFVTIPATEWQTATQASDYTDTLTVLVTVDN